MRNGKEDGTDHTGNCPSRQHVAMDRTQFLSAKNIAQVGWDDREAGTVARKQQAKSNGEDCGYLAENQDDQHNNVNDKNQAVGQWTANPVRKRSPDKAAETVEQT